MGRGERGDGEGRDRRHQRAGWARWSWLVPEIVALVLVAVAMAELQWGLGHRWLGLPVADPVTAPARVLPPEGLDIAAQPAAPEVAGSSPGGSLDRAAVRRALAPYAGSKALGPHADLVVAELATGQVVYRRGTGAVIPASTMKLLTSTAALETLGPMTRFRTTVRQAGDQVVLVGGGDPYLMPSRAKAKGLYPRRADLGTLARRTAQALAGQGLTAVRLAYDDSLFSGPAVNPAWPASYIAEFVAPPITALWSNQGAEPGGRYVADPSAAAARVFRKALARNGVAVTGGIEHVTADASAPEVAAVEGAPLGEVVEHLLAVSDNNAAEVVAHHVGIARGEGGSFAGAAAAVSAVLAGLDVDLTGSSIRDGSGLSRENRLTPAALIGVLGVAADRPRLRQAITGMPVAGFTGSLQWRFEDGPAEAKGRVRAKTGTLTGVHGLAGVAVDAQGNRMAFVLIADQVAMDQQLAARKQIDLMAAALGACSCGATP